MFQVGSIFCSRLELLSRTAAGNRAYVTGRHNTTSRRIQTWFLFISQRTLRETSRIFAWKFASNFRVDRIVARKFAAYYRKPRTISRKFARIKTIDVAKRNIVEKPRKAWISLKFVCITFSQYCITIPASYLMKLLILSEELFLSKRVMVAWSKHNTIVLSGGTINTAANLECWRWRCGLQVLEQKRIPSLQYFKFLKLFTIVLLEDLSGL